MGNFIERAMVSAFKNAAYGNRTNNTKSNNSSKNTVVFDHRDSRVSYSSDYKCDKTKAELQEKMQRVNSKWNKFKNYFGCGEKMTFAEEAKLRNYQLEDMHRKLSDTHDSSSQDW